ncbi:MAG: TlpA family protein disulfide reductase [Desulfobacteraceae bacterium]|nr:TlpA family protein disulfide reductase [Desulfobacteraceae bacterium]
MTISTICRRSAFPAFFAIVLSILSLAPPAASAAAPQDASAAAPQDGKAAPDLELQDLTGNKVALGSYKGKTPVMLYFWATWCPYCLSARPGVVKLRNEIPKSSLEILAVNVGGGDSLAKVKRFEEAHPAPFKVLFDAEGKAVRAFAVQGIPLFVIIDKNGNIVYRANELPADPMKHLKQ